MTVPTAPPQRIALLRWLDAGILAVGVVFFVLRPFVAEVVTVTAPSMQPTLRGSTTPQIDGPSDLLLVNRYLYHLRSPRRGEVVVLRLSPDNTERDSGEVVKRVIGLPGDRVEIGDDGRVVLNGHPLIERYLKAPSNRVMPPLVVPAGHLFVLGDNRPVSRDSSAFEFDRTVDLRQVRGKVTAVCWPLDRVKLLP